MQAAPWNAHSAGGRHQADEAARQAQREDGRLAAAQAEVAADIRRLEDELRALHRRATVLADERRALAAVVPQVARKLGICQQQCLDL